MGLWILDCWDSKDFVIQVSVFGTLPLKFKINQRPKTKDNTWLTTQYEFHVVQELDFGVANQ